MKKIFTMLLAVTLIMTCMVVAPVGAEAPDLTQDFVKTFVETTTSAQAADSLIKTQEGQENAYRLFNGNNIAGRNSTQVETTSEAVVDIDETSKWGTVTVYPTGTEITEGTDVISGAKIPADNSKRDWLDKSGLKDGDTLVVSIYAKTAEEGKKTFFNMGLIENSKTFGYNALTAEYGTTGMEIDSSWKKFAGTITIPNGFEQDTMADKTYYTLHFGYPVPCANPAKIHVSTVYAAKAAAVDMTLSMDQAQLKIGESTTAKAQRLNQIGTSAGVSQNFTWYVTNGDRTQILTDSGITVTPGENGEATVTAGASVQSGSYAIVAVGENGEVKGLPL
ncbi:MAG: hypothetical protein SO147_04400, partial [Clostridia bacterium]|nr:hypothetical protein [Clostridia bacterium]